MSFLIHWREAAWSNDEAEWKYSFPFPRIGAGAPRRLPPYLGSHLALTPLLVAAADIVLDGRLQVSGGAPSAPQLQLALLNSSSAAFQQAARFYTTLVSLSRLSTANKGQRKTFNCMPLCE